MPPEETRLSEEEAPEEEAVDEEGSEEEGFEEEVWEDEAPEETASKGNPRDNIPPEPTPLDQTPQERESLHGQPSKGESPKKTPFEVLAELTRAEGKSRVEEWLSKLSERGSSHESLEGDSTERVSPSRRNSQVLSVRKSSISRGWGVFADVKLNKGHKVIVETPALTFNWPGGPHSLGGAWARLNDERKMIFIRAFPRMRKIPFDRYEWSEDDRRTFEKFKKEYGFIDNTGHGHVYLLASTINHACQACANAEFWVDSARPYAITLRLVRTLGKDDELFICYNKRGLDFGCAICLGRKRRKYSSKAPSSRG
ncbi:hypothetical protein B0T10DRAFT_111922 [Thelonectria olida]|uniref:SET domain-containing protein n=1 Tax=Thelonectria olida TaxID=1576542 RepID=A0A9P9AWB4_9HYPO|nr:hypothetical protein B0T10DRAFT_111922 [Thelonectria olida]